MRIFNFCKCGCGKLVNKKRNFYISGHNRRNQKLSEEHKRKIGKTNSISLLGKKASKETKKKMRNNASRYWLGKKLSKEHCEKLSISHQIFYILHPNHQVREKNPMWKDGKSFEPYSAEFNKTLKIKVKKRDKYKCAKCNSSGVIGKNQYGIYTKNRLDVHHKDENKKNNNILNLISLCPSCHSKMKSKEVMLKDEY